MNMKVFGPNPQLTLQQFLNYALELRALQNKIFWHKSVFTYLFYIDTVHNKM